MLSPYIDDQHFIHRGIPVRYASFDEFLSKCGGMLAKGPIGLVFAEDDIEVDTTLRHHLEAGFSPLILIAAAELRLAPTLEAQIHRIDMDVYADGALVGVMNRLILAAPDVWIYYCFNAEYLFFPFCEQRSVREMLAFHMEERRDAMMSYVVDLYAANLTDFPNAVSLETAYIDKSGYYALAREDAANNWAKRDRQMDFFGGLRWRFEEYIPWTKRRIDRIALFRAKAGVTLRDDFTLSDEEMNTYACPWHNNLTTVIASFRTAKALRANAGSRFAINTYLWQNSVPFEWHSQQLMDLGLMEPGQWF
jgi:hypothetical protein